MIEVFVARRRGRWERLSALLDRAGSPRRSLSVDELDELAALYRRTTGDLAIARRDFPHDRVTLFINQLITRGHAIIYRERPSSLRRLGRFFSTEVPREYRALWPYLAASAALFFVPLIAMAVAVILVPDWAELVLPSQIISQVKGGSDWFDEELSHRSLLSSVIMTNNIRVSLLALGGGMLAGIGTVLALLFNGVHIGAVAGTLIAYGLGDRLLGFVAGHSFLELSVIVIAGACGLRLGRAVVWPGLQTRSRAFTDAAGSIRLAAASLILLIFAGLIEGFISPSHLPWPIKLAIGVSTGVALYSYLLLAGRGDERRSGSSQE